MNTIEVQDGRLEIDHDKHGVRLNIIIPSLNEKRTIRITDWKVFMDIASAMIEEGTKVWPNVKKMYDETDI